MTFEEYLISKKIDAKAFKEAESELFLSWHVEYDQMHPNSFTSQKLYLINPIRLKYRLISKQEDLKSTSNTSSIRDNSIVHVDDQPQRAPQSEANPEVKPPQVPKVARPVFKSKPKPS